MPAEIHPVSQNYGIDRWGEGYFGINAQGHLTVTPRRDSGPLHRPARAGARDP